MAKRKLSSPSKKPIQQYEHSDKKRLNNPPVGLVTPDTEPTKTETKGYAYDPHLDPQLNWPARANTRPSKCPRFRCTSTSGLIPGRSSRPRIDLKPLADLAECLQIRQIASLDSGERRGAYASSAESPRRTRTSSSAFSKSGKSWQ